MNFYSTDSYRAAVNDLKKKFPDTYHPGDKWEKALGELEQNRKAYTDGLQQQDAKIEKKVVRLLDCLDAALLANPLLEGKKVVAIKRELGKNDRKAMSRQLGIAPSNFQNNSEISNPQKGWNNQFVVLKPEDGKVLQDELYSPPAGMIVSDPEPYFDGTKLMYSSIGTSNRWHLFELDVRNGQTRQLTPDTYKDFDSFDGCYTPEGNYIFCSTGTFLGLPCTNGGNKMCGLFSYNPKTGQTRQLTYDQDSNWGPVMMENGTVLYQRWEYADLPHSNSRIMFTMNPDGTTQTSFYGSNSYFPTSFFNARPIPGKPSCIVGIATGHHSVCLLYTSPSPRD